MPFHRHDWLVGVSSWTSKHSGNFPEADPVCPLTLPRLCVEGTPPDTPLRAFPRVQCDFEISAYLGEGAAVSRLPPIPSAARLSLTVASRGLWPAISRAAARPPEYAACTSRADPKQTLSPIPFWPRMAGATVSRATRHHRSESKIQFSRLIDSALAEPTTVEDHKGTVVVVLADEAYRRLKQLRLTLRRGYGSENDEVY